MKNDEQHIETLKRLLCEATGCEAKRPGDFLIMSVFVRNRTRQTVGVNTLKRLYHYGGETVEPRMETLNVLARSLCYRNYADFCQHHGDGLQNQSSDVVLGVHISSSALMTGQRVCLRWNPGRECVAEYLGNDTFRVVASEQTKLVVGDTFQASFFALGHTALLSNLIHGDNAFPLYEIGKQGGLTLVEVLDK